MCWNWATGRQVAEAASLITERSGMLEVKEVRSTDTRKSTWKAAEKVTYQQYSGIHTVCMCAFVSIYVSISRINPFRPFCGTEVRPQQCSKTNQLPWQRRSWQRTGTRSLAGGGLSLWCHAHPCAVIVSEEWAARAAGLTEFSWFYMTRCRTG